MQKKMTESHGRIISDLEEHIIPAKFDRLSKGKQIYNFSDEVNRKVYIIKEGDFIIRTKRGGKIVNIVSAPFVIGFIPVMGTPSIYMEKIDYGRIYSIEYNQFWSLVCFRGLFQDVMKIMSGYHTDLLDCIQSYSSKAEDQVVNAISRWAKFPNHIKKRFSVLYFLTNSTFLSKSTASRVIKKLKENDSIRLDNGRLVD